MKIANSTTVSESTFWIGIRDIHNGSAGFIALWELDLGTGVLGCTSVTDAAARGGTAMYAPFATYPTLRERLTIFWSDVQTNASLTNDLVGDYLVLARMRVDSGSTEVAVQLRSGWGGATGYDGFDIHNTQYIDGNTDYMLYEMGKVKIPPINRDGNFDAVLGEWAFVFMAEFLGGTQSTAKLYLDYIVLIPAEHLVTAKNCIFGSGLGDLYLRLPPMISNMPMVSRMVVIPVHIIASLVSISGSYLHLVASWLWQHRTQRLTH